jgi:hypothetical protein
VFNQVGGFDEGFSLVCNDTDFCLKVVTSELSCVVAATPGLIHHEGVSREGYTESGDTQVFREKWEWLLKFGDPYMNPNIRYSSGGASVDINYTSALRPRQNWLLDAS